MRQQRLRQCKLFRSEALLWCLCAWSATGLSRDGSGIYGREQAAPFSEELGLVAENTAQAAAANGVELSILKDLQIGSFEGGADAVAGGLVQSAWSPSSPTVVGPNERQTRLWALLSNVAAREVPLGALTVTSADPSLAVAHVRWPGGSSPQRASVGTVLKPLVVDVAYECRRSGAVGFTVGYRFADPRLAPVELTLTKECGQRSRVGLCLGTSADQLDSVVRNGVTRWSTESALKRMIPASQNEVELMWTLRATGGQDDTAEQLMAPPRIRVTPLSLKLVPEGPVPPTEAARWRRRLAGKAAQEVNEEKRGIWGLNGAPLKLSGGQQVPEVARVHLVGALQDGGALPAAARLPPGSPPPKLKLELECLRKGAALIEVEVSTFPAYQPYRPAVFSFVKRCGGIMKEGFDVATHMLVPAFVAPNLIKDGVHTTKNGFAGDVGNLDNTFSLYWRLADRSRGPPDAMRVTCDGGMVSSELIPSPAPTRATGGILAGRQDMRFTCSRSGVSWCTLHFAWNLYEGPSLRLRKFCGGARQDIDVFSDMAGAPAVLLQGKEDRAWGINPEVTLPADQDKTTFTVSLDRTLKPGEKLLKVSPPQLRVFNPDVVEALAVGELAAGGEVDGDKDGGSDLQVETKCKKSGTSRIEVTLPISSFEPFKPLNFAFTKRCTVVSYYQQWWIVSLMTFGTLFAFSCLIMTVCVFRFQGQLKEERFLQEP